MGTFSSFDVARGENFRFLTCFAGKFVETLQLYLLRHTRQNQCVIVREVKLHVKCI